MNDCPVGVLDLGTNSTRFLLVDEGHRGFSPDRLLDRDTVVTRLGEGVDEDGSLTPRAVDRVLNVLDDYDRRVRAHDGTWQSAVATSACRRADNGEQFLDRVEAVISTRPEIISGDREADVIFKGVCASLPEYESGQIMDIGGGSTEWIVFEEGTCVYRESRPVGVVTLRERCGSGDRWDEKGTDQARDIVREVRPSRSTAGPLIVVGGTGTTLSAHRQQLNEYDPEAVHGDRISLEDVSAIRADFESMTFDEISQFPMVQPGREDVMVPGIVILESFAEAVDVADVVVSDYGILAGLVEEGIPLESTG